MVTVIEYIGSYLESDYGKIIGIEGEISTMIKSFYDPRVEEKGVVNSNINIIEGLEKN